MDSSKLRYKPIDWDAQQGSDVLNHDATSARGKTYPCIRIRVCSSVRICLMPSLACIRISYETVSIKPFAKDLMRAHLISQLKWQAAANNRIDRSSPYIPPLTVELLRDCLPLRRSQV